MIKNKKGFTLIELIIVMAIIGILAVIAIVAISNKAGDARDARRKADLAAVQTAFALASADGNGSSAVNGGTIGVVSAGNDPTDADGNTLMDMSTVQDPTSSRQGNACATNNAGTDDTTCSTAGDYTFLEVGSDSTGTFSNYKIGATLEDGTSYIYATPSGLIQ